MKISGNALVIEPYGVLASRPMSDFGKAVKRLRKAHHLSRAELAVKAGVTERQIYTWERLQAPNLQGANYRALAEAFGITTTDLDRAWRNNKIEQTIGDPVRRAVPIINKAPAGEVVDYHECSTVDSGQGHWYTPRDGVDDPNAFAVIIVGDSMIPYLISGSVAVFSPMDTDGHTHHRRILIPEGHVVFVRFTPDFKKGDGCTVARWRRKGKKIELVKDNPKYASIVCATEEIARMSALVRFDALPGMTKMLPANEVLDSKGESDKQREGQVFPDYENP